MGEPYAGHPVYQRCAIDYEMSTSGEGTILPSERANIIAGKTTVADEAGLEGRNAFAQSGDGGDPSNRVGA